MRKKLIFCMGFALLSLILFFIWKEQTEVAKEQEILLNCFNASRADFEESVLSGWTSIDVMFNEEELNNKIDFIINGLSLDKSKTNKTIEIGENFNKGMLTGLKESGSYTMILESMLNNDGGLESYCMFRTSFVGDIKNMMKEKQLIENLLKEIGLPVKLDAMITGSYKGKMSQKQINATVSKLLKVLGAIKIESIERDDFVSISAYCVDIGEYITAKGKKVNVQIALRYSSYDNRTYIWLGSPIIPFEY